MKEKMKEKIMNLRQFQVALYTVERKYCSRMFYFRIFWPGVDCIEYKLFSIFQLLGFHISIIKLK